MTKFKILKFIIIAVALTLSCVVIMNSTTEAVRSSTSIEVEP